MVVCKQTMEKIMPHLSQVAVQVVYAGMNIINTVALEDGMNNFIFVTYRQIIATLVIAPLAYVLERWENADMRNRRGQAKVAGIIISVSGAMVMTLYKGPEIKMLNVNLNAHNSKVNNRILGSTLLFGGVISWSAWIIFQVPVLKKYPTQLSLTAIMCFLGAVQSGVIALICEHKTSSAWVIGWNIELLSYVYSGVLSSAFAIFVQAWCIHKKGSVFVAIFDPLRTVVVAILQYFVLRDNLDAGCVVGAILVIMGLYPVLWGKAEDSKIEEGDIVDSPSEATANDILLPLLQN